MAKGFTVLVADLEQGSGRRIEFGDRVRHLGGSGLAAALYLTVTVSWTLIQRILLRRRYPVR